MKAYTVKLNGKEIDTVFYDSGYKNRQERQEDVKRSLVNHDGYNPEITVKEEKKKGI